MFSPGTRVAFPAKRGDQSVTATGTVQPSSLVQWRKVLVDRTTGRVVIAVHVDSLTLLV